MSEPISQTVSAATDAATEASGGVYATISENKTTIGLGLGCIILLYAGYRWCTAKETKEETLERERAAAQKRADDCSEKINKLHEEKAKAT